MQEARLDERVPGFARPDPGADLADESRDIAAGLAQRLTSGPIVQDVAPLVVVGLLVVLLADEVPILNLGVWLAAVGLTTLVRALTRVRLAHTAPPPGQILRTMRVRVVLAAAAWAAGPVLFQPYMPVAHVGLLAMVFAGLIAGATATLMADPVAFYLFTAILLAGLEYGFLAGGLSDDALMAAMLVTFFGGVIIVVYRHAHGRLRELLATTRRLAASERRVARERSYLDALFASAPTAIAVIGADDRLVAVNPAFERQFGYRFDEAHGRDIDDLIVPPDGRAESHRIRNELSQNHILITETERTHRDGHRVHVLLSAAVAGDAAEGAAFVIYDDITDRKCAENALREKEEHYRLLVESATDLVWQVDLEGRWTYLNQTCVQIYGRPPDQLIGQSAEGVTSPQTREQDAAAFARLLCGEELIDYDTIHIDAQGRPVHLAFAGRALRDGGGRIIGAAGSARDVTARMTIQAETERARLEAERAASMKSAFLANMSHEIRTPMNGVLGMADLLLDTSLDDQQRRSVDVIRSSAEALLSVINDVLDFSKIEAGRVILDQQVFDLHGLLDSAVRLLAARAFEKEIRLECQVLPGVPRWVRGDPGRLRQILNNLIGNAVKFTERGSVEVSVRVTGQRPASRTTLAFAVRDTGIGIARDKIETIFEEFSQGDMTTTRRFGGTGLGLAIARRLARMMGGELSVASAPGEGSEFVLTCAFEVAGPGNESPANSGVSRLVGRRALVVDDNATNRRVARAMLRGAGLRVAGAAGAEPALRALHHAVESGQPFDLVLLDAHMPSCDGFGLAARIRTDRAFDGTRLVMLTSGGSPGDGRRCMELGIEGYLTKPFSRSELLDALAAVASSPPRRQPQGALVTRHSIDESRRRLRILLAEDNAVNQEVALAMLRRRGHHVDAVVDGREAVEAVARQPYDVVLMDLQMPVMDGITATARIRALPGRGHTRILAVTAHALAEERQRCLDAGMDGHIAKPFRPHELFAALEAEPHPAQAAPGNGTKSNGAGSAAAATSSPETVVEPALDIEAFRATLREAGVEDAMDAMLDAFALDYPGRRRAIEEASDAAAAVALRAAAHALKSGAGAIRAVPLARLLQQAESHARDGRVDQAVALRASILAAGDAVMAVLVARRSRAPV